MFHTNNHVSYIKKGYTFFIRITILKNANIAKKNMNLLHH